MARELAHMLPELGISHVFELIGGMTTVMIDALYESPGITVVPMHHEQGAGFAAEGFARMAGVPAVAMATSGPGATNVITAIASCYFDSVPAVFITGQVNRSEMWIDRPGRQGGFQETDICRIVEPITKWATMIAEPTDFRDSLRTAFATAVGGRPGPVLLDIPMDVQRALIPAAALQASTEAPLGTLSTAGSADTFICELKNSLERSARPIVIAGGGIRTAAAVEEFRRFARNTGIPVASSLMGIDVLPAESPNRIGMLGSYGNRWTNWAIAHADLLLVLGSRLDIRQTGSDPPGFAGDRAIFHVDIDDTELGSRISGGHRLSMDIGRFLGEAGITELRPPDTAGWLREIRSKEADWPDTAENIPHGGINPNVAVRELTSRWKSVSAFVTDVGQHQMWSAQSAQLLPHQRFLTSGGLGAMGFGLPASIGAALAAPGLPVCLIAGDGGLQCNIQELQVIVRTGLPIRIVVFDNKCQGMVRQFQESYFDARYCSTVIGYSSPNFAAVADAYGIRAWSVDDHASLTAVIDEVGLSAEPCLIHINIEPSLNVYPKMAFGQPFGSMEPDVFSTEMEGT